MRLTLAKLFWTYDLELVNKDIDWMGRARSHVLWHRPELRVHVRCAQPETLNNLASN